MRTGLLRVASTLLFVPVFLLPSKIFAQTATPPDQGSAPASAAVTHPVMIHPVGLEFRDEMMKLKLTSVDVGVALTVDKQGIPQNVHVVHSDGPEMDAAAIEAAKESRFTPALKDGEPIAEDIAFDMKLQFYQDKNEAAAALAKIKDAGGIHLSATPEAEASDKYAIPGCTVDHAKPSDADMALAARKYADAERLYGEALAADPASSAAMAGLVRTTLAEGKLPEALALAMKFSSAHPNDAVLLDALAAARFRRGETDEAGNALNQSVKLDRCIALTHYDMARDLYLLGLHASAQREFERAYWLSPENPDISRTWHGTHAVPLTDEQKLTLLRKLLENASLPDARKDAINAAIKGIESSEKGGCEQVSPIEEVRLTIVPVPDNGSIENMEEGGLELQINGKKRRLEIDTGASGLTLSAASAKALDLIPEAQVKLIGVGDDGPATAIVSHVDDIKIGKMEFRNCMVRVLPAGNMLDRVPDVDGLIGPDVFRDYLVTLDYPGREMRLGPLPAPPDQQRTNVVSLSTTGDQTETPVSLADSARDRYIAPEMKDWTPVFRAQHMLIVPTLLNNAPVKLFLLDTGSQISLVSPSAAKEIGQISDFTGVKLMGINGVIRKVPAVSNVSMLIGPVKQTRRNMLILDTGGQTRSAGVEVSGIIGFPILRELVLSIDYRDNLVHFVYDPKKGFHAHNDNGAPVN